MRDRMTLEQFGKESAEIKSLVFNSCMQPWRNATDPISFYVIFKKIEVCYTYPGVIVLSDEQKQIIFELTRIKSVYTIKDQEKIKGYVVEFEKDKCNLQAINCVILEIEDQSIA